ncbi:MAG: DEAD/DEAH box helicase [Bacteroidetes bacterium]|nr:DEAD/DEAH box helicase [Bacteroidota bacterium]
MVKELIDNNLAFESVYSIYLHPQVGYLLGAYVVQCNPTGGLSLKSQRLLPENFPQFAHRLDDKDRELTRILNELTVQALFKQFGQKFSSIDQFLKKFDKIPTQEYIQTYIQRRLAQALPLLSDRNFYLMGKDGYPAFKQLRISDAKAFANFNFDRTPTETRYRAFVKLGEERLDLYRQPVALLTSEPCWMMVGDTAFTFDQKLDGKKLLPFINKRYISIPKSMEAEYFRKFLLRLIEDYPVWATGFTIEKEDGEPHFVLNINSDAQNNYTFSMSVEYGKYAFPLVPFRAVSASMQYDEATDDYRFVKLRRRAEPEKAMQQFFEEIRGGSQLLSDLVLNEEEAYRWLYKHAPAILERRIDIRQQGSGKQLMFQRPRLEAQVTEAEHQYHVHAHVAVGPHKLPLSAIRSHILRGNQKLALPDGTEALLPTEWLEDWKHFFEVARQADDGTYTLQRYQGSLLQTLADGQQSQEDHRKLRAQEIEAFDSIPQQPLPEGLQATPRDYQWAGYDWLCFLKEYGLGGILADDMGLGKTLQTLTLLLREHNGEQAADAPSLIVVPNSLVFNWQAEARKFAPALRCLQYTGLRRQEQLSKFPDHHLIITTYGTVRQDLELLLQYRFHYVVLDESQTIKNRDAKITRAVLKLQAAHRLSLTGTPIENTAMDLWTQMQFLNPGLLGSESFFAKYYALPIERERNERRAEALRKLTAPFIMRRTKDMVATELPPRTDQVQLCEMTPEQHRLYSETKGAIRQTLFSEQALDSLHTNKLQVLSGLQRLRQIAIHPRLVAPEEPMDSGKYTEMWEMLDNILQSGSKVLIFSQFVKFLQIVKYDLMQRGIRFSYIDGSVKDRGKEVDNFQNDPDIPVFLISLKAGGTGLNLTAAEYVFLLDPWWNPAIEQQAMNRAHRIGQQKAVFVYKFITEGSIEEKILKLQERKQQLAGDIIHTEENFFKSLDKEDLLDLLA